MQKKPTRYRLTYDKNGNSHRIITNGSISVIFKIDEATLSYEIKEVLSGRILKVRHQCTSKSALRYGLRRDIDDIMETYNSEKMEAWGIPLTKKQKRFL